MNPPMGLEQAPEPMQPSSEIAVRQASPEEQQVYNQFVGLSMILLYDKKFMETALELLRKERTTMEGVAKVAALVAFRVYEDGQKKGREIPAAVVVHAGMEVVGLVAEMAMAAGLKSMNEQETELAYYGAADHFRDLIEKAGLANPEQMEADRQQLDQMQQDGRLAGVMAEIQKAQGQMAPPQTMGGLG